jgi:tetratricopeptide (TPR) repeat protein
MIIIHIERLKFSLVILSAVLVFACLSCCKPGKENANIKQDAVSKEANSGRQFDGALAKALAAARLELANGQLAVGCYDRALLFVISALEADPKSLAARGKLLEIFADHAWALPEMRLHHGQRVDHLEFREPDSLWVASSGQWNTVARWNLEGPAIESVLFPRKVGVSRSIKISPSGRSMVIEREGYALLCDAQSLKPINKLGRLPEKMTPGSVIAFSADGLLVAHPSLIYGESGKIAWHLRDAKSGDIIRSSEAMDASAPRVLAAFLDRKRLRVLHSDGSSWMMPVSPIEPCQWENATDAIDLKHACFEPDGLTAWVLAERGAHMEPELSMLPKTSKSPDVWQLLGDHPWTLQASVWSSLYRGVDKLLRVDGKKAWLGGSAPLLLRADSNITALHRSAKHLVLGKESGEIDFYRVVAMPKRTDLADITWIADQALLLSMKQLACALTGISLEDDGLTQVYHGPEGRINSAARCDFDVLGRGFPEIDFTSLREFMAAWSFKSSDVPGASMLCKRITEADPKQAGDLKSIEELFASGDLSRILKSIDNSEAQGPVAAKHLQLVLASSNASAIDACLRRYTSMPRMLQVLAHSRMSWIEKRKANAIMQWPEPFPDYDVIRREEDWHGWEQVDFSDAFNAMRDCVTGEIDALKVSPDSTKEQLQELAARLENPETIQTVGRARYAKACIDAAFGFCKFKDYGKTALGLATHARNLGQAPEPCLRAEAMAYTALGDFRKARDRWLMLLTDFPVSAHEPGDYAEAAYTAFENGNAQQAVEILVAGIHRFPRDADFALRAGWIALLTDNFEKAYRFLLSGREIGYRKEKIENAIALLAIAASRCGAKEDASAHYMNLVQVDPAWRDPKTIATLEWPEDLKSTLESVRSTSLLIPLTR